MNPTAPTHGGRLSGHAPWDPSLWQPGYASGEGIGGDGFQEVFTASVTAALEWGAFGYARAVLDNYAEHFLRRHGSILYRGLEMAQQGRMLTVFAMYYRCGAATCLI